MSMENSTENRICKATIDCGDGGVNEIEGEGIIAIALTQEDGGVNVQGNIEGIHSVNTITAAIGSMQKTFGEIWDRAIIAATMERMFGKMRGDAEQPGEASDGQAEEGGIMTMSERKTELRWHKQALEHARERRAELLHKYGKSLPHRELMQEYVDWLDEDMRWHEGRMRELEAAI